MREPNPLFDALMDSLDELEDCCVAGYAGHDAQLKKNAAAFNAFVKGLPKPTGEQVDAYMRRAKQLTGVLLADRS